jgi:hypothetical protein
LGKKYAKENEKAPLQVLLLIRLVELIGIEPTTS